MFAEGLYGQPDELKDERCAVHALFSVSSLLIGHDGQLDRMPKRNRAGCCGKFLCLFHCAKREIRE